MSIVYEINEYLKSTYDSISGCLSDDERELFHSLFDQCKINLNNFESISIFDEYFADIKEQLESNQTITLSSSTAILFKTFINLVYQLRRKQFLIAKLNDFRNAQHDYANPFWDEEFTLRLNEFNHNDNLHMERLEANLAQIRQNIFFSLVKLTNFKLSDFNVSDFSYSNQTNNELLKLRNSILELPMIQLVEKYKGIIIDGDLGTNEANQIKKIRKKLNDISQSIIQFLDNFDNYCNNDLHRIQELNNKYTSKFILSNRSKEKLYRYINLSEGLKRNSDTIEELGNDLAELVSENVRSFINPFSQEKHKWQKAADQVMKLDDLNKSIKSYLSSNNKYDLEAKKIIRYAKINESTYINRSKKINALRDEYNYLQNIGKSLAVKLKKENKLINLMSQAKPKSFLNFLKANWLKTVISGILFATASLAITMPLSLLPLAIICVAGVALTIGIITGVIAGVIKNELFIRKLKMINLYDDSTIKDKLQPNKKSSGTPVNDKIIGKTNAARHIKGQSKTTREFKKPSNHKMGFFDVVGPKIDGLLNCAASLKFK